MNKTAPKWLSLCFRCGKQTEDELFCVVRRKMVNEKRAFNEDHDDYVLEALSSVQICSSCMEKMPDVGLTLKVDPLQSLAFERQAIYWYAEWLANWPPIGEIWDKEIKEPLVCQECHRAIQKWHRYVLVQIVRAANGYSDHVLAVLRIMCDECATTMGMAWFNSQTEWPGAFGALASKKKGDS